MNDHSGNDEFVFSPSRLVIHVGTRVIWRNHSMQPHTVTATGSPPAFDSGTQTLINRRHTWAHVFRQVGTYHYYCLLHPYMKGTIVVQP
jgi:plastocyanin